MNKINEMTAFKYLLPAFLLLGLSACAAPSVLIISSTRENGDKVLASVYKHNPEINGKKAKIVVAGILEPGFVVENLNWAEKHDVKYIGMDNGVMGAVPGLIVPKLQELEGKGFIIGGMMFAEPRRGL